MPQDAGTVYAEIRVDLESLSKDINEVKNMFIALAGKLDKPIKDTNKKNESLKQSITAISIAFMAVKSAVDTFVGALKTGYEWVQKNINAYNAQQAELAKLNAVIQSTGAIAWTTGERLAEMADKLSISTGYTQNEIMEMQAVLLGFRGIVGETFERTTKAILDMSAVMGGDLVSAANTIGKAIDTPVQGMTALARQGFVFRQEDKLLVQQMVESGDILKARNFILEELEKTYAGTAESVANATASMSAYNRAQKALIERDAERGRALDVNNSRFQNWLASTREASAQFLRIDNNAKAAMQNMAGYQEALKQQKQRLTVLIQQQATATADEFKEIQAAIEITTVEIARLNRAIAQSNLDILTKEINDAWSIAAHYMGTSTNNAEAFAKWAAEAGADLMRRNEVLSRGVKYFDDEVKRIETENGLLVQRRETEKQLYQNMKNELDKISDTEKARIQNIGEINNLYRLGAITADEYYSKMASAYQSEVDKLNQIFINAKNIETTEENKIKIQNDANKALEEAVRLQNYWSNLSKNRNMTEKEFLEERNRIMEEYDKKLAHLDRMRTARQIDDIEYEKQVLTLRNNQVTALDNLIELAGATAEEYPKTYEILTEINNALLDQKKLVDSFKEDETLRKKTNDLLSEYNKIGLEEYEINKLNYEIEKARVQEMIKMGEVSEKTGQAYLESLELVFNKQKQQDLNSLITNYENKIKQLGRTTKQAIEDEKQAALKLAEIYKDDEGFDELIKNINKYYDKLKENSGWQSFAGNAAKAIGEVNRLFESITNMFIAFAKRDTDNYIAELERRNEALQTALDEELQARLFAAGLTSAATKDQHDIELQKAITTGDHRLVYEKEQAKKRYEIEKDIADKKEEAEKKLRQEKAKEEFKYAMAQWNLQKVQAAASMAQAILMAMASAPWPYNLIPIGFATGIGTAQMVIIQANQPKMQTFAQGGIVSGDPYRGDNTPIMAKGKEMLLTEQDQSSLFDMIRKGENQPIYVNTIIELDGAIIAEKIFSIGTRGNAFINARGVV